MIKYESLGIKCNKVNKISNSLLKGNQREVTGY